MSTSGRRRTHPGALVAAILGGILAVAGLFLTYTGNYESRKWDLGHTLIGGAVLLGCLLAVWRIRRDSP